MAPSPGQAVLASPTGPPPPPPPPSLSANDSPVLLTPYASLGDHTELPLTATLQVVLERYNVKTAREHVKRFRSLLRTPPSVVSALPPPPPQTEDLKPPPTPDENVNTSKSRVLPSATGSGSCKAPLAVSGILSACTTASSLVSRKSKKAK